MLQYKRFRGGKARHPLRLCPVADANAWTPSRASQLHFRANMLQTQRSFEKAAPVGFRTAMTLPMTRSRTTVLTAAAPASEPQPMPARRAALTGCPWHDVKAMLREVGLRPTRQRMELGWLLFCKGDRHITAELLYEEASSAKAPVSLATVYNTLHQFTDVGLLRQVAVDGSKTYFDTNASLHHHFFVEGENTLLDIPDADVFVGTPPIPPEGYEIARIDVVVRLRRKAR